MINYFRHIQFAVTLNLLTKLSLSLMAFLTVRELHSLSRFTTSSEKTLWRTPSTSTSINTNGRTPNWRTSLAAFRRPMKSLEISPWDKILLWINGLILGSNRVGSTFLKESPNMTRINLFKLSRSNNHLMRRLDKTDWENRSSMLHSMTPISKNTSSKESF